MHLGSLLGIAGGLSEHSLARFGRHIERGEFVEQFVGSPTQHPKSGKQHS
jgi:hypothetical protein